MRLRVIALGGIREIGKNSTAVEYRGEMVLVDAGVKFPEEELRGIDLLIPDVSYIQQRRDHLRALLLTHGHEDHIGAVPYVLPLLAGDRPLPIYGSPLTVGFVRERLREHRIERLADLRPIEPRKRYQIGRFGAEFFRVAHSIPDSMALALHTPVGTLFFTGDFKLDQELPPSRRTDLEGITALGEAGVLALLSDATRSERPGATPSERVVTEALDSIIRAAPGRVIISTFASNIARLGDVLRTAARLGRRAALVGRSIEQNGRVAMELGYLPADSPPSPVEDVLRLPKRRQLLLTTGSQGEATAALSRMAAGIHPRVRIVEGDTVVISATPVPGNEETVAQTIDALFAQGAHVIYPGLDPTVHVSGHASQDELRQMIRSVQPRFVVPIHGEYRHLVLFGDLCREEGIGPERVYLPQLGQPLEFDRTGVRRGRPVPSGTLLVDRLEVGGRERIVLRREGEMAESGVVLAAVVIDRVSGRLVGDPTLTAKGFPADSQLEVATQALRRELSRGRRGQPAYGDLVERTKQSVGRSIYRTMHKRPLIIPMVAEV
ncbi:MAG: ribonuclease J [Chloroflexota bacterium]